MGIRTDNAQALYLNAIRDGNYVDAITTYSGERYTQHSTPVKDGQSGFIEFFAEFVERNPIRDIKIIRAWEDGQYVFLHVVQILNDGEFRYVTADIFDTDDDGRLIEHWDMITEWVEPTVSGRTQVDGPTEPTDLDKTEENKTLVRGFLDEVLVGGNVDKVTDYISSETYHQHNPQVGDGLEGFAAFVEQLAADDIAMQYNEVHLVIGCGDFVAALSEMRLGDQPIAVMDLFRVADGKIVEHWDVMEDILPEDQWVNSGKFGNAATSLRPSATSNDDLAEGSTAPKQATHTAAGAPKPKKRGIGSFLKKAALRFALAFLALVVVFLLYWFIPGDHPERAGHEFGVYPTLIAEVTSEPRVAGESTSAVAPEPEGIPFANGASEPVAPFGSGHAELEGTLINYEYVGFGGFYLAIQEDTIKWKGFVGSFKNVIAEVDPQVSKVGDDLYLLSWPVSGNNGDNVLMNFRDMTVFGHLSQGGPIDMISGSIYCVNEPECIEPEGEPMGTPRFVLGLVQNMVRTRTWISDATLGVAGPGDFAGREELLGKVFIYETDTETVTVRFLDEQQNAALEGMSDDELAPNQYLVNATLAGEGIYFMSWQIGEGDQHIVYNSHSGKVYDHIADDGTREEMIYEAISLD